MKGKGRRVDDTLKAHSCELSGRDWEAEGTGAANCLRLLVGMTAIPGTIMGGQLTL